jgi:hypothetical protein
MRTAIFAVILGCSSAGGGADDLVDAGGSDAADSSATTDTNTGLNTDSVPETEGGPACIAPDMLIALDRTLTMHRKPDATTPTDGPDYKSSKWYQAITAIEAVAKAPLDTTIRFGLELWPKASPGCITLAQRVADSPMATNPMCETGEILVSPALSTGAKIASILDPATTKICVTTPTGQGLIEGANHLASIKEKGRDQYILLVTDGADWDASCPTPNPVAVTQENARKGIKTFILGFSNDGTLVMNGVGVPFLNDMACAGMTAIDFAKNCKGDVATGYTAIDSLKGPQLFYQAGDAAGLDTAMKAATKLICCDCPK